MRELLSRLRDVVVLQQPQLDTAGGEENYFANHCPHCGSLQEDLYLHSEPDQPFFSIPRAAPGAVRLTRLEGRVELSGDESFEV